MADADRHAGHDPLLIAALLDDDPTGLDRNAAASLVASCPACAALHVDLLALSSATRALPIPPRSRDFRLTADDAARLTGARGEPVTSSPRLTGVTTDTSPSHASHDTILVASLADHSLVTSEREAAEALVAACGLCAALHADLLALAAATRAMPTPTRPRDYTLTQADAARLRPGGWRRLVAAFGSPRDAFSRPLAVGLTTLGLAGLLVATVPSMLQGVSFGSAASAQRDSATAPGAAANPEISTDASGPAAAPGAAGPSAEGGVPVYRALASPAPVAAGSNDGALRPQRASDDPGQVGITSDGATKGAGDAGGPPAPTDGPAAPSTEQPLVDEGTAGLPTMILVSGALLIVGLGLFFIRWTARQFGDD